MYSKIIIEYIFSIYFVLSNVCDCQNLKLEQVFIVSRHNVRTPLSKNLMEFTPKTWPTWIEKSGYLTAKGALLEGFMGEFFSSWLKTHGLLNEDCPDEKSLYVYSNNFQRSVASAEAFVNKAYPLCNITVHHYPDVQQDPIFSPVIHNSSKTFKIEAIEEMQSLLSSLHLNSSFKDLENILDYKQSKYCLVKQKCDFVKDKHKIFVHTGFKPNLEGPLKISKSVIDSFIMESYEGFPIENVAWGTLQNTTQWNSILDLKTEYLNIIFNTTLVAKDLSQPMLNLFYNLLLKQQHKVILLMAHDANIYTLLKSMSFYPYILQNQYETIPIGGKVVFQKWQEQTTGVFYLKIQFVYQNSQHMREGKKLSLANPPEFTLLELKECKIDEQGFCPWDDFVKLLKSLIKKV